MLGVVLTWSGAFTAIKVALRDVTALDLTLLRFLVAAPFLAVMLYAAGAPKLARAEWPTFLFVSFLSVGGYHLALNAGETRISAGIAALVVATGPLWTGLFSGLVLGERFAIGRLAGMSLAMAGVVLLVVGEHAGLDVSYGAWVFVALLAPIGWGLSSVLSKPLVMRHGALPFTASATLVGTLMILPILATGTAERAASLSRDGVAAILFLGLAATVFGYVGFNDALRRLTPTETMTFVFLNPVFGVVWGFLLLDERPAPLALAGGLVILFGVLLAQRR
ncbi:MAG: DMT family transporter [Methanobacteriota archaeon]